MGDPRKSFGASSRGAHERKAARGLHLDCPAEVLHSDPSNLEPIPIIGGSGALGGGLAMRWARAGCHVVIGSRSEERAREAADRVRRLAPEGQVEGAINEEAARRGPIVVLTVPFRAQSENLNNLRQALEPGQLLVDCTAPLAAAVGGRATRSLGVWQGSAAQQAQEMVPDGVTVVAALHTLSAPRLGDPGATVDEDVLICGERRADKARVAALVEVIPGLRAVNAGTLEIARIVEQLTPLLISINARYKSRAGLRITDLPDGDHWA
jgi:8-hydroxy-5-deazaflavin:NADPH oxidoreductase